MDLATAVSISRQMTVQQGTHEKAFTTSKIHYAWKLLCQNTKGGINRKDAENLLRTFFPGISASDFEHMIGPIKGRLTYSELKSLLQSDVLPVNFDPVLAAFRVFDRDHSSFLSADELCHFVSQLPEVGKMSSEDVQVVMGLVDKDKDGKISVDDFRVFMKNVLDPGLLQ